MSGLGRIGQGHRQGTVETEVYTLLTLATSERSCQLAEVELMLWEFSGRRKYFVLGRVSGRDGIREGFKEEGAFRPGMQEAGYGGIFWKQAFL